MTKIIFAMYNSETDCVEVSLNAKIHVSFNCQKCNTSVRLDEPSDIAYLTRLAREEPGLYAKLASRDGGLQWYIEAMGEFNRELPHRFSLRIINYNLLTFTITPRFVCTGYMATSLYNSPYIGNQVKKSLLL